MKMMLNSLRYTSGIGVTVGETYEHIGSQFRDDNGINRLVAGFGWKVIPLGDEDKVNYADHISETIHLKDDDRVETAPLKASDTQVGGSHYTDLKIQPLELTFANFGYAGLKAAIYTKVNKYMTRNKDNEIQQLKKARHCLDFLIEKAELENENNS